MSPNQGPKGRQPGKKPYGFSLPNGMGNVKSFNSQAVLRLDKAINLGEALTDPLPQATVIITDLPASLNLGRERFYEAPEAYEFLMAIMSRKGIRWAVADGKFQLLVDGEEINSWPTTEAIKKGDTWLLGVAQKYLEPEVLAVMFPAK